MSDNTRIVVYPHSGICARCRRDRDDLFWHEQDRKFYCADVFACEARYVIQGDRQERQERRAQARGSVNAGRSD